MQTVKYKSHSSLYHRYYAIISMVILRSVNGRASDRLTFLKFFAEGGSSSMATVEPFTLCGVRFASAISSLVPRPPLAG